MFINTSRCLWLLKIRRVLFDMSSTAYGESFFLFLSPFCVSLWSSHYSHPSKFITRACHDGSTSNLRWHVERCAPADSPEARQMASYVHGSSYSPEKLRMKVAIWVSRRNWPFAIIEDQELLDIFHDLHNKVETPSRQTVSRDIKQMVDISQKQVAKMLQVGLHSFHQNWAEYCL